jgi:SAM-dependent methyltransferase
MKTPASSPVDLYNVSYGNYTLDVYRDVRLETYGEDFGQTSWVTTEESQSIPQLLQLTCDSSVLELGCGSGRYALQVADQVGCRINGVDLNAAGIANATRLAQDMGLGSRAQFECCDVSEGIPFKDAAFDAVYANDVLCHVPDRASLFREILRVLKPGARFLFSDALIIAGPVGNEELSTRSSIGLYVFLPTGENERLLAEAGFHLLACSDKTASAAAIARRWHDARQKRQADLLHLEGEANFMGLQKFLKCVETLTTERRLLRHLYLAGK